MAIVQWGYDEKKALQLCMHERWQKKVRDSVSILLVKRNSDLWNVSYLQCHRQPPHVCSILQYRVGAIEGSYTV